MGYSSSLFALLLGSIVLLSRGFFLSARFSAGHRSTALQAVTDIGSTEEFDAALAAAGENVLVVDYSTTWCGPCKFVLPKFEELSEKYDDVVFLKVYPASSLSYFTVLGTCFLTKPPPFDFI